MTELNQPAPDDSPESSAASRQPAAPAEGAGGAGAPEPGAAPAPPTPGGKKKRRRIPTWLKAVGVVVLLLILLVLFAPSIASTGPVRSFVLGKVNDNLNGRIEVADWSLGWTSGLKLNGVRVLDAAGEPMVQVASMTTQLTLLDAIRGRYALGETVIDGLDFRLRREADGQLNVAKLARAGAPAHPSPAPAPQPAPGEAPKPAGEPAAPAGSAQAAAAPTKLPNLSGNVTVRNSRGSFEDVVKKQSVQFPSIEGNVKIPDINQPIENALTVVAAAADGQRGTLKLGGSVDVVENNELRIEAANVDETVELVGLGLPALAAFLPPGTIDTMRGDTNATVVVRMTAGQGGFVEAQLTSDGFAAGGPALKGDTLTARQLAITVPRTTIDMSSGLGAWTNWPIRTGGDKPQPITIALVHEGHQDAVTLGLDATPQSLMNLAENLKPAATGRVDLGVDVDVGALARQLPAVFPERDGRRLTSAKLAQAVRADLTPQRANLTETLDLTDIALANADGSTARLEPIHQAFRAGTLGGGWAMPELRDIRLVLNSGFARAEFGGAELGNLSGTATGDLAQTQAELGQFIPMDGMSLAGTFVVALTSSGDVANPAAPATLGAVVTFTDLGLDGIAGLDGLRQGHTRLEAAAEVHRSEAGIQALRGVRVVARTGESEQKLTLDSELTALVNFSESTRTNPATRQPETVRTPEVPEFTIRKLTADLAAAQRDFPSQFAGLSGQGLRIESGVLSLTGSGSYKGAGAAFDLKGGVNDLDLTRVPPVRATASATLAQVPPAPENVAVLRDYALSLDAAGAYVPGDASSSSSSSTVRLSRLSITDNQKMLALDKGKPELVIASGASGVQPAGEIRLGADVKKLMDVMRAFSAEPAVLAADEPGGAELTSGRLGGSLQLGPAEPGLMAVNGKFDLTNVTVRTAAEPIENEKIAVVLKLRSRSDFSYLNVDELTATGRLVNAKVTDTVIDLGASDAAGAPPLAAVGRANVAVDLPNLKDVHALLRALSPPPALAPAPERVAAAQQPAAPAAQPAAAPAPEPRRRRFEAPAARAPRGGGGEATGRDVIGRRPGARDGAAPAEPRRELPAGPADPDGTVTVAPAADDRAPAPPPEIRSGAMTLTLTLVRDGGVTVVTPEIVARDLSFRAGEAFKKVGDVTCRTTVRLVSRESAPAGAGLMERVRELTIPSLVFTGAGAEVELEKPLVMKDPAAALGSLGAAAAATRPAGSAPNPGADAAVLSAVLHGRVNLAEFCSILEAWQGAEPGTMYPYAGMMVTRQELATTPGGAFRSVGHADVKDFALTGEGGSRFAEPHIGFGQTITFDPNAKVLTVEDLALVMETTKAVRMTLTGAVHEVDTARRFEDMVAKIDYDAAVLWDVLRPLMDPETGGKSLEEIALTGKRVSDIRIGGSYPAGDPNAIQALRVDGGFALETLVARGLNVSQLDLRFLLEGGILRLEHANPTTQAEGAVPGSACNGGVVSFQGFTVDFTGDHPRLDTPDDHPFIRGATINPVVADSIIGRFVNPAFAGAEQARGLLDVTVVSCRGLALGSAMQSPDPAVSGRAELRWTLTDLFLSQPELIAWVSKIKPNALNENGFRGSIKDGRIVIEGGQVYSDMMLNIDEFALGFNGGIGLAQNKLVNFSVALPPSLFAAIDDKFERVVPAEGYKIALTGTTDNWIQNATRSIGPIIADLGVRSAVGGLFNRESDREKRERRQREREARERGEKMPADKPAAPADAAPPSEPPPPEGVIGRPRGERPDADARDADAPVAEPAPADPLGDLLERAIGGKRETDAEKEARRERVRKERREREERERQQRESQ
jgi:hypothetical protein